MVIVFLLYIGSTSYNLVLVIEIYFFLEYKSIVLHILSLILLLVVRVKDNRLNVRVVNNELYFIFLFLFPFYFHVCFSLYLGLRFSVTSWSQLSQTCHTICYTSYILYITITIT